MISSYLRNLRQYIGHELILMPSVAVLVWDERGHLLLVKNIDKGHWQTIGGSIDVDESPEQAALREASEEANIQIKIKELRTVLGGKDYRIAYPNGDQVAYVSIVFDAEVVAGEIEADKEETSEVRWWPKEELKGAKLDSFTNKLLADVGVLDRI